jgi:hypothetical protein
MRKSLPLQLPRKADARVHNGIKPEVHLGIITAPSTVHAAGAVV